MIRCRIENKKKNVESENLEKGKAVKKYDFLTAFGFVPVAASWPPSVVVDKNKKNDKTGDGGEIGDGETPINDWLDQNVNENNSLHHK
ncbi:MAG: hypothetical protein A3D67_02285 [Candidatus Lloydbacteria bacterium RIFCSPHIGHO2_02_FULL_51_22]|uniref:Uncharacterized protein n=2 Tax=Candidatus Lloydiibacteriota TaxID=1817910 RepID=A0A1G2DAN6_9BACT|nr:MAG: hypothetical protein A3D67_02285 [Candidatus Lloydbacteria bacterium RIFCSPHIGHO2_02_FULL_51_22]OGZ17285.1 MAG: hypothetical protein A3G11_01790 [Candidatus Lloydbacteria bacterium RIFCSPLOWO2_12_FULL_51_9]